MLLKQWFPTWGSFAFFYRVARASAKNIHNFFYSTFYVSYIEPLFVVTEIIGSHDKNDSLLTFSLKIDLSLIMTIAKFSV